MGLREHLKVLRRRWISVVVLTVLAVDLTGTASVLATPVYTSTVSLFFSLESGGNANDLNQGATFTRDQMSSYATLATTPAVLGPVIDDLDLDVDVRSLADQVSATATDETVILDIAVSDTSPRRAAQIADAVADQLTDVVADLSPQNDQGDPSVRSTVVTPANTPRFASSPNTRLNVATGLVAGLLLGVLLALVREALDTRLRDVRQLRTLTDAPLLGQLPVEAASADGLVVNDQPQGAQAELYRQLRTNVQFLQVGGRPLSLVVTSSVPGEGKSTVALNLALAMAEVSDRVLLVDADLRLPTVAHRLGIEGAAGLSTVLVGRAGFDDVVQEWGPRRLHVLTSGLVPPNPTELLASPAMSALAAELAGRYDVVVYDTAPTLPVTDALVLSRCTDGVVLVASTARVRRPQLCEALESLARVDARLLGLVVNMLPAREAAGTYGSYGYGTPQTGRAGSLAARVRTRLRGGRPAAGGRTPAAALARTVEHAARPAGVARPEVEAPAAVAPAEPADVPTEDDGPHGPGGTPGRGAVTVGRSGATVRGPVSSDGRDQRAGRGPSRPVRQPQR